MASFFGARSSEDWSINLSDMSDLVSEWVAKGEEDWSSAQILLRDKSPLVTPALFHLQQCAEKLLKALLIKKKIHFERRHDLSYLLLLADESKLNCHSGMLNRLNPFAVEIRYPGDLPQFSVNEAQKLLNGVADFREVILPLLGSKSR